MNRDLKFRVWANCDDGMKMIYLGTCDCDNGLWFASDEHIDDYKNAIMQYTGLHDKNDKEIWEGDILKGNEGMYFYGKGNDRSDVFFEGGSFCVSILYDVTSVELSSFETVYRQKLKKTTSDKEIKQLWLEHQDKVPQLAEVEVIGNIYANPELLQS